MPYGLRQTDEATLEVFGGKLRVKDAGLDQSKTAAYKTYINPSTGFTIEHENKAVVHIIFSSAFVMIQTDSSTAIADGTVPGQKLRIIVTATADVFVALLTIKNNANTKLLGDWIRGFSGASAIPAWIELVWDGADWQQNNTNDGQPTAITGTNAHAEGNLTTASGNNAHAEGSGTTASGGGAHAEGNTTTASGERSHAEGNNTTASGNDSHAEGIYSVASLLAEQAHSSGRFAASGDAQNSKVQLRISTMNATQTEMFLDGYGSRLTILDEYTYACKVMVAARQDSGLDHFMGIYHVLIQRTSGTVALVGAVNTIYENNAGGLAGVTISADDVNKSLKVSVQGAAGHNIRWLASVEMVRVHYAD